MPRWLSGAAAELGKDVGICSSAAKAGEDSVVTSSNVEAVASSAISAYSTKMAAVGIRGQSAVAVVTTERDFDLELGGVRFVDSVGVAPI